uniref:Uncharacterized protein n=1 Tax=Cucumis melo TaxID=3656 RepID=A0A9I9D998_CUCME
MAQPSNKACAQAVHMTCKKEVNVRLYAHSTMRAKHARAFWVCGHDACVAFTVRLVRGKALKP